MCIHVYKALCIHDHPTKGLDSVTSTATRKNHAYSGGLLDQICKEGQRGTGRDRKDQKVKLSDWSIAQQQVLTSEALGFTAVRMGLPEAPESGLCSSSGGLKGEDPFVG